MHETTDIFPTPQAHIISPITMKANHGENTLVILRLIYVCPATRMSDVFNNRDLQTSYGGNQGQ